MIDSITKQGSILGVSVLPVFVKTGTWDKADVSDAQVYKFSSSSLAPIRGEGR